MEQIPMTNHLPTQFLPTPTKTHLSTQMDYQLKKSPIQILFKQLNSQMDQLLLSSIKRELTLPYLQM